MIGADGNLIHVALEDDATTELLQWSELWARSYAQFIGERSGSRKLASEIRTLSLPQDYLPSMLWSAADFKPVALEVERVLKTKRWMA
jgi:hypothetical protein